MDGVDLVGATPWCLRLLPPGRWASRAGEVSAAVDAASLRPRCERRVEDLLAQTGIPRPWHIDAFLDRIEQARGRDIDLCAVPYRPGDSTGAWLRREDHDILVYPDNTAGPHQDHILLHEIGHMISQHRGRCVLSSEDAQCLAPDLDARAFVHLLDRAATVSEEQEAEMIAQLLHQNVRAQPLIAPEAQPRIARIAEIFGG